jgi:cobalamin biosynthesis protein CobD/CbiB
VITERHWRRVIAWGVLLAVLAAAGWVLPRVLPRSPVTIAVACVAAVLIMKLVEHRVRRWLRRLAAQRAAEARRSPPGSY